MATLRLLSAAPSAGGHGAEVFSCSYTPDGNQVLSGGWDGHLRLWEAKTGSHLTGFRAGEKAISACAISPDNKWVITMPLKTGGLSVIPTGVGESRQLTHDNVSYGAVQYFADGKRLIAGGIEPGHGRRDYVIDVATGASKPITPEGVAGIVLSPDARSVAVSGPDGNPGIWSFDTNSLRSIPGLDSNYVIAGWAPDGNSLYAASFQDRWRSGSTKVYRVNIASGRMEFWKEFGTNLPAGTAGSGVATPRFSADGSAYAYIYVQVLSEAYVVKGLK